MSSTAKLAISLPRSLLGDVDEVSMETHRSRSAIIREAVERFLTEYEERRSLQKAAAVYEAIAEEDGRLHRVFSPVSAETLPAYDTGEEVSRRARAAKR
ncbi:MAG: ribbon-helix-helix protein, CopG family [Armatimonadetes bacterium]|nr:ribbon-helix-helix protein, CopG family [Armatimonadota bacterium]